MIQRCYENPWFSVDIEGGYFYIQERNAGRGAVIVVLCNDAVLLVKVRRPIFGQTFLEMPRGYVEAGESVVEGAARELREEAGIILSNDRFEFLGDMQSNSAIIKSQTSIFLVSLGEGELQDLRPGDEVLDICWIPLSQISELLFSGGLKDGFTLSALMFLMAWRERKGSS